MLTVYRTYKDVPKNMALIKYCDPEFAKLRINPLPTTIALLKEIEQATYLDTTYFIDKTGCKVHWDNLSQGCKVALTVERTSYVLDTVECGQNAIWSIIRNCKQGNIVTYLLDGTVPTPRFGEDEDRIPVDVLVEGNYFTNLKQLNDWIRR